MKKTIIFTFVILFVAVSSYFVFAKEHSAQTDVNSNTAIKQDANSGAVNKQQSCKYTTDIAMAVRPPCPMCQLHSALTQSMMQIQMAAPVNGGIIVLVGNRLLKYDYDLNLVRETEVPINLEETQKQIEEITKNCLSCRRMMEQY
jgi:hypothetical protein